MTQRFCLDTSFLINGWHKHYRIDVFPSLWDVLGTLMDEGVVFSCEDVFRELKDKEDTLLKWAKQHRNAFERPTEEVLGNLAQIMRRFSNFAAQGGARNRADPIVIAHAQVDDAVLVTDEHPSEKQKPTKPPKIPNVCSTLGIPWMTPIDFLAAIDIAF